MNKYATVYNAALSKLAAGETVGPAASGTVAGYTTAAQPATNWRQKMLKSVAPRPVGIGLLQATPDIAARRFNTALTNMRTGRAGLFGGVGSAVGQAWNSLPQVGKDFATGGIPKAVGRVAGSYVGRTAANMQPNNYGALTRANTSVPLYRYNNTRLRRPLGRLTATRYPGAGLATSP